LKLSHSKNNIKQSFHHILDKYGLNRFSGRKVDLLLIDNTLKLDSHLVSITELEIERLANDINSQVNSVFDEYFNDQDLEVFLMKVVQISQNRLDFLMELLELNQNIAENFPFIYQIITKLPSLDLPNYFEQIIEIANKKIQLSVIDVFLNGIQISSQSFNNLYYLATHLDPIVLKYIELENNIFYLDHHKIIHLVKILNRDPFLGRDIVLFLNKLSTDVESTISYVSLITNPLITQINQIRFIHTIYKRIDKPFTDKDFILRIILNEDYITLNFYLGFFKRYNKYEINSFIEKLKSMSLLEKIKLEIGLFTSKISTIKQIING